MIDCFTILPCIPKASEDFKEVVQTEQDFAMLGGVYKQDVAQPVTLLADLRDRWKSRTPEEKLEAKLAFILSWLTHLAARRQLPARRTTQRFSHLDEQSLLLDMRIVYERFAGRTQPTRTSDQEVRVNSQDVETFLQVLKERALVALHTIRPDKPKQITDIHQWLEQLFDLHQTFDRDVPHYAAALTQVVTEGASSTQAPGADRPYYDEYDPFITLAQRLQQHQSIDGDEVANVLDGEARCHYGAAIKQGLTYLLAASRFFQHHSDVDSLNRALAPNSGDTARVSADT